MWTSSDVNYTLLRRARKRKYKVNIYRPNEIKTE